MKIAFIQWFALMLVCSTLQASQVIDLGFGRAKAINDSGQVLFEADNGDTYIWRQGCARTQARLTIRAAALNNAGEATGNAFQVFAWFPAIQDTTGNSSRSVHVLGWFEQYDGLIAGSGLAINSHNQITGWCYVPGDTHAFLYDKTGLHDIGIPGEQSTGTDINDSGTVVGYAYNPKSGRVFPFIYENGMARHLIEEDGKANAINNGGIIVGELNSRIMIYQHGEVITPDYGAADDINDSGQVVGIWFPCRTCNAVAFLYRDGVITPLKDPEWELTRATGINTKGEIIGYGLHHGLSRAFLFLP